MKLEASCPQAVPARKSGEGFDAPPTLERSGSEHRRAVTSFPSRREGLVRMWSPPWQRRDEVDRKVPSLTKEGRGGLKNLTR